jgi:hypothetical protein
VSAPVAPQTTSTPALTIPANFQAANTTTTYPLTASTKIADSTGLRDPVVDDSPTTVRITTSADGKLSTLVFSLPLGGANHDAPVGLTLADPIQLAQLASILKPIYGPNPTGDDYVLGLSQSAGAQTLSSSAFGLWATSYETDKNGNGAGRAYAFAFGNLTPASSMPATGSATYNGTTTGLGGGGGDNSVYALQGKAQIVANFSAQSVATSLTNLTTQNIYTNAMSSLPDLTGTSTISGNAYSGPIAGTGFSGSIKGNFFGPAAQETAGVWQASGGGSTWLGSYGAK